MSSSGGVTGVDSLTGFDFFGTFVLSLCVGVVFHFLTFTERGGRDILILFRDDTLGCRKERRTRGAVGKPVAITVTRTAPFLSEPSVTAPKMTFASDR